MWKVERTCSFGFIGEDEFNSFDSAKIEFRHMARMVFRMACAMGKG